jgi:membrane protein implicated in regulation of membrane protease activity
MFSVEPIHCRAGVLQRDTMDWSLPTWWWMAAGVLIAAELATGTFYLLMLALGAVAGALTAHTGLGFNSQLLAAALVGGGAVAALHFRRQSQTAALPAAENRDVNIDIGERIEVTAWSPDGSGQAMYRGARWSVRHAGSGTPQPGWHVITSVEGNRLHVERMNERKGAQP